LLLAQLEERADSNTLYMEQKRDGCCVAVIDSAWSDDDPRRCRSDWISADDDYSLLRQVGESLTGIPFWVSDELRPYIPYRRRETETSAEGSRCRW